MRETTFKIPALMNLVKDSSPHEHRQLLTYRVTFDNDLKNSPNFNEENKPFTQQNSPGRSKSFNNSSFTMHNAPPRGG